MTASLFLRLYPATVLAVLLVTELAVPFGPVRRWLSRAPHLAVNTDGLEEQWAVVAPNHVPISGPYPTRKEAALHLRWKDRVKSDVHDLVTCAWCAGFWLAAGVVGGYALWAGDGGLLWWQPAVWAASSATVVILDAIAEA
jgi:sterol desaturase/sphingolipid hydroxylase (fatty acid hydroxylase superfamily)